jgi:hypothetical protein
LDPFASKRLSRDSRSATRVARLVFSCSRLFSMAEPPDSKEELSL